MKKNYLDQFIRYFRQTRNSNLIPSTNEEDYQKNPTKIRTSEQSQVQDSKEDIKTRSPERKAFEDQRREGQ